LKANITAQHGSSNENYAEHKSTTSLAPQVIHCCFRLVYFDYFYLYKQYLSHTHISAFIVLPTVITVGNILSWHSHVAENYAAS